MKVIQFVPSLDSGGVEKGVLEVSNALVDAGHESHVVSAGGRMVDQLESNGAIHHSWRLDKKRLSTLRLIKPLREWILKIKPDVLHKLKYIKVPTFIEKKLVVDKKGNVIDELINNKSVYNKNQNYQNYQNNQNNKTSRSQNYPSNNDMNEVVQEEWDNEEQNTQQPQPQPKPKPKYKCTKKYYRLPNTISRSGIDRI